MSGAETVNVTLSMGDSEAWALAQLCKRFTWEDTVRLSNRHDGGVERDFMLAAMCQISRALAEQDIRPC
jgi:hypothetical protein